MESWDLSSNFTSLQLYQIPYIITGLCDGVECKNGGICDEGEEEFECHCTSAYKGTYCEEGMLQTFRKFVELSVQEVYVLNSSLQTRAMVYPATMEVPAEC